MGFLDNIFSSISKNTYRGICKAMIDSYNKVKQQNPKATKKELYALALSLRPTWERENPSSFTFAKGRHKLTIEKKDTFKDVVRNVIILETRPPFTSDPNYFVEVAEVVGKEFKNFKE